MSTMETRPVVTLELARRAIDAGLAYVTEDRKELGLVLEEPISKNITLANLPGVARGGVLSRGEERQVAERYREAMNIPPSSQRRKQQQLNGHARPR